MRIGVDARLMHHQKAGISKYTWHLLQAFASIDLDDEFITFQHRKHREPIIANGRFRRATLISPVHTRLEQVMLPLELLRFALDVLHCPDFIPPLHYHSPTVITVHDLAFLYYPHFLTSNHAAYYSQIDRAVRAAEAVIVPSESTKKDLIAMIGVPNTKIDVIYEAAASMFTPLPEEDARRFALEQFGLSSPFVLFVGTIEPRKNIVGLLHAFHHLRTAYNDTQTTLVIAGSMGWLSGETIETVERLDLGSSVRFLGRVDDEALHQLYVAARCHVHPAYYEGFGLPPLEAMACGTPTIVSNVSSLPEVVQDAALLVDPANPEEIAVAMHRLLDDDALHAEMREKGLARARCFSWERAAASTLEVYRKAADIRSISPARLASSTEKT